MRKTKKFAFMKVSHGSGREFMQIGRIGRELVGKYDKLYISAFNKYFAEALASEFPDKVVVIDGAEIGTFWHNHWAEREDFDILNEDPYNVGEFSMRRANIYDTWRELYGLEPSRDNEPYVENIQEIRNAAIDFSKQHKKFVLVQFWGGQNPVGDRSRGYNYNEVGLHRHYPIELANEVCTKLRAEGYDVVQYTLPNEPHCRDAIFLNQEQNQLFYHELAKYADGVVTIDSSLQHLTVHQMKERKKPMVVIWVQTDPKSFGYDYPTNIQKNDVKDFMGPSMTEVPLNPEVKYPTPDEVVDAFKNF